MPDGESGIFITVFVCDTPDRPPKTAENGIARAAGNPDIVRGDSINPVVISTNPVSGGFTDSGSMEDSQIKPARMEYSMIYPPILTIISREAIMISSNGLPSGAVLQVTGKGEGSFFPCKELYKKAVDYDREIDGIAAIKGKEPYRPGEECM